MYGKAKSRIFSFCAESVAKSENNTAPLGQHFKSVRK